MIQAGDVVQTKYGTCTIVAIEGDTVLIRPTSGNAIRQVNIKETKNWMAKTNVYTVTLQSPFILNQSQLKQRFGVGFKILSIETEKDLPNVAISDVDSAVSAIVGVGYRSLARANHPDLGGDPEVMVILNRAKKELKELLESVR